MMWILAYLIVGMIYVSFGMQPFLRKSLKDIEGESEKEIITIVVTLFLICIFTPVWPALVTLKIVTKFNKYVSKE
ncbi:hypothetical protein BK767_28475 [Bacillus thuringiensis serovar kyushuensis]|uniref:TMhelix containing protein n=1 Tax=Bacillus cereus TaxID=1396 RepID=A0AAW4R227_BACCE|nr:MULTISPECIES: hypothetical protein [Bacillus cereus group]MBY0039242.1 hypothetical protein [Bacillus cereus]MEC2862047.1 hypothetical protein [Bacillus cereus]OTZ62363.1 hypothetical protein BK767_28475 [Bacillus thuringiensis serovar kyushuensis]OTZ65183.1 hypothetical protein BK768_27410 [Bacillus thuringiensis serovar tohokuensis]OUB81439.1 hypothetical protein BK773_27280 [Bacillus thuringiensis serovar indiana]